jgi:osmotically-inducible protein OsmY/sporulation protein YlmC with PRC-barrel domain
VAEFDLRIGDHVYCEGEPCGRLMKVVVDPHTQRVTDLIVERGILLKTDRVLPISAVEQTADRDVHLGIGRDELEDYPKYREVDFTKPTPGWGESERYKAEHVVCWTGLYGRACREPVVPRVRQRVHKGVSSDLEVIARDTPVHNDAGTLGEVDHVLVDSASGEITHLIVRNLVVEDELFPYYPIVPISMVEYVSEEGVFVKATTEELAEIPHYAPRADSDLLLELQDRLKASSVDLSGVKAILEDGVARLTGLARDVVSKRRAEATARSVEGVIDVENALDTDTVVVARVIAALADDPRTGMAVIDVTSERGVITLKGRVDSVEIREAAEEIAADQDAVVSVVNGLQVGPDEDSEALKPLSAIPANWPHRFH